MATPTVHRYNKEMVTSNKKVARQVFKFTIGAAGAVGTISQAKAGLVASVAHTATGVYTVTLTKPHRPSKLLRCSPEYYPPAAGSAVLVARHRAGSFSASAGTFIIDVTAVPVTATDPASGGEISVELVYSLNRILED